MSTTTKRESLARIVPRLAPEQLHELIQYRGLDACGELVTSATPAQLTSLLDLDLWRPAQPGLNEEFDVDRFGEWLEVLVDTGESVAARTIASLDADLVIAGLSRYLRVFDPGIFEPTESTDDEPMDRHEMMSSETSSDVLECEVGGYLLRARRTDAWDAILTLLATLETEHTSYFHTVMQGCRRLSNSTPEIDGLDDLLLAPEQHLHDVAGERDHRQSLRGYATAADARAFLQMAREPRPASHTLKASINPIAAAYFRVADEELPAEARVRPARPRALPEAADDSRAARLPLLKRLLASAMKHDERAYLARSREMAFLANTLLAGCSVQSRPFTPEEASDAAACICNLGLECWPGASASAAVPLPDAFLSDHDLVTAFEVGWSVLYRDVSLLVADRLVTTLSDLALVDAIDPDTRGGLRAFQRKLVKQREAGTPWLARDAADVLAMLDMTAWVGVLGLLGECPIVAAALPAVLERRTTSVSPTAFEFISTTGQIGDIRVFIRVLPSLLSP